MDKEIKVAIGAIAKCENLYIREWVEYHKNLGACKIFLYDNNEIDGEHFEDVIGDYIASKFVEVIDYRGKTYKVNSNNPQTDMCNDCYQMVSKDYPEIDWLAIIDIDEFITFKDNITINEFLAQDKFNNCECVRLNWKMYTDSGLYKIENNNYSITRFTEWRNEQMGKSILKTKLEKLYKRGKIGGHGSCDTVNVDEEGNRLPIFSNRIAIVNPNPKYKYAWINHYKSKTIEEFIYRRCVIQDVVKDFYRPQSFFTYSNRTREKEEWGKVICKKYGIKWE